MDWHRSVIFSPQLISMPCHYIVFKYRVMTSLNLWLLTSPNNNWACLSCSIGVTNLHLKSQNILSPKTLIGKFLNHLKSLTNLFRNTPKTQCRSQPPPPNPSLLPGDSLHLPTPSTFNGQIKNIYKLHKSTSKFRIFIKSIAQVLSLQSFKTCSQH